MPHQKRKNKKYKITLHLQVRTKAGAPRDNFQWTELAHELYVAFKTSHSTSVWTPRYRLFTSQDASGVRIFSWIKHANLKIKELQLTYQNTFLFISLVASNKWRTGKAIRFSFYFDSCHCQLSQWHENTGRLAVRNTSVQLKFVLYL